MPKGVSCRMEGGRRGPRAHGHPDAHPIPELPTLRSLLRVSGIGCPLQRAFFLAACGAIRLRTAARFGRQVLGILKSFYGLSGSVSLPSAGLAPLHPRRERAGPRPLLHRGRARPSRMFVGGALTPATPAPGLGRPSHGTFLSSNRSTPLGSPRPHPHRDWARPRHIRTGTGLAPATSARGLGSPPPHLRRDCTGVFGDSRCVLFP